MHDQIKKYTQKLLRDRTVVPESVRFSCRGNVAAENQRDAWAPLFTQVYKELDLTALLFAKTSLPFPDLLIERADPKSEKLVPKDSETRVILHDLPFIRERVWKHKPKSELAALIVSLLKDRKAVLLQNLGVVATGVASAEQAYIGFSTIFHTTFVKYLLDLLVEGFRLPQEQKLFEDFRKSWLKLPDLSDLVFAPLEPNSECGLRIEKADSIHKEICQVGRYTVEKGYVDSFFGNISYFDGKTIYISQTTSSLDELEGRIVLAPLAYSPGTGLSASSELPAHRGIYASSDYRAVLHGHPKFSVVLSMFCEEEQCDIEDCNRFCTRKRSACGIPIVYGETGMGGLEKSVPLAIKENGVCIAYGHGVFSAGKKDFQDAFMKMAQAEDTCREKYFELLEKMQSAK